MTISTSTSRSGPYAGAGTTGPFVVGFRFLENSHLKVVKTSSSGVETVLTLSLDYTVSGAGGSGGSVTTTAAVAVGDSITIVRDVPYTQVTDYTQSDPFPAQSHEDALDKLTMLAQQLKTRTDRSLRVPEEIVLPDLPAIADRASRILGFDSSGNPIGVLPTPGDATALALDLANTTSATKGAGMVGFLYSLSYGVGTLGRWLKDLALSTGAGFIGFLQTGTSAVLRNLLDRGQDTVSAFDFMTAAQIADVKARSRMLDVSDALMAAINSRSQGATVLLPPGDYKLNQTLNIFRKGKLIGSGMSETADRNATVILYKSSAVSGPGILLAQDSAGYVIEGVELDGQVGNGGDGIVIWTNSVTLRNCSVYRMGRNNIRIGKDGFGANANNWCLDRVVSDIAGVHGIVVNDKYDSTLTGSIASGLANFTASGSFFEASCVGYPFTVVGAGAAGANLVTTIATYVSPTQVTLAAPAGTTVTVAEFYALPDANAGAALQPTANRNLANGFLFQNAQLNTVLGVHAELNGSYGLQLGKLSQKNNFFGGDLAEGNVVDFVCDSGSYDNAVWGVPYVTGADNSGRCAIYTTGKGTFTPAVTFGGSGVGITYGARYGEWTRTGNRIQGSVAVTLTNKGAAAGVMQITGLPYMSKNVGVNGAAFVNTASNFTGLGGAISAYVPVNTSVLSLTQSSATGLADVTNADATNTTVIQLSFDYIVAD